MKQYICTDLAFEDFGRMAKNSLRTREFRCGLHGEFQVFEANIETEEQERRYGRSRGRYMTVFPGKIWSLSGESFHSLSQGVADLVFDLLQTKLLTEKPCFTVLVAGIGNPMFTADAVGAQTVEKLNATRGILETGQEKPIFSLAAMATGVSAKTGMEALEQIRGVVQSIGADATIVVDSLLASSYERLGATIQLSDAGICPGSGVGNHRTAITEQTVGVPVLAIGIPTVVDAATLICDAIKRGGMDALLPKIEKAISASKGYLVCPKESDLITESAAFLIADALEHIGSIKRRSEAYSEA